MRKNILFTRPAPAGHWVGDGFPVRSLFSYQDDAEHFSPFLLLDHAGPAEFPPASKPRGVGTHPHRGFETVTIVYDGEVAHRDSAGHGGVIGPGDVQWMTAAGGILHEEFHSDEFTRRGGGLEMAQLWVNLPARHKMTAPRYQSIAAARIPRLPLAGGAGEARIVAGRWQDTVGPAETFSELNVWDIRLNADGAASLAVPDGHNTVLVLLRGSVCINDARVLESGHIAVLARSGDEVKIESAAGATLLLLSGVPLGEPVVGYGPFVMNSVAEIETALRDFQSGRFGQIEAVELEQAASR